MVLSLAASFLQLLLQVPHARGACMSDIRKRCLKKKEMNRSFRSLDLFFKDGDPCFTLQGERVCRLTLQDI